MKVDRQRPPVSGYTAKGAPASGVSARSGASAAPPPNVAPPRLAVDVTQVVGIPEAEFTPRVRAAIMSLMAEVDRLRQELDQTRKRLDQTQTSADQDPLLPMLNRRAFVREMSRMMAFAGRYKAPTSLVYLDLNGFKAVNDAFGHSAGDAALVHICSLLTANIRESDILGRLGGDEFGIILANADAETAQRKALTLNERLIEAPFRWQDRALEISFAFGVYPLEGDKTASEAIAQADEAMYRAKKRGKHAVSAT
jgi:diguanylate cyclase (GGDEF)-like protein